MLKSERAVSKFMSPSQYLALSMSAPNLKLLSSTHANDNYFDHNCVNPKLIELSLCFRMHNEARFFKKLGADAPNLKRLTIKSPTPISSLQFQLILSKFRKLESLSVDQDPDSKLRRNLENFSTFHAVFNVVKANCYGVIAATDTETFIRERGRQLKTNKFG